MIVIVRMIAIHVFISTTTISSSSNTSCSTGIHIITVVNPISKTWIFAGFTNNGLHNLQYCRFDTTAITATTGMMSVGVINRGQIRSGICNVMGNVLMLIIMIGGGIRFTSIVCICSGFGLGRTFVARINVC